MSPRAAARLAWSIWTLSVPFAALSGLLGFLNASAQDQPDLGWGVLFVVLLLTFPTVGALVASRRPENPIGWIFCAEGLLLSVAISASTYATYALHARPGQLLGIQYAAWVAGWVPLPTIFLAATLLFLLFPNGRLLSLEWRFVGWVAVLGCAMAAIGGALGRAETTGIDYGGSIPNPVAIGGGAGNLLLKLEGFGSVLQVLSCAASVTSSLARWARARGQERQQLKWFAYAAAMMIGGFSLALAFGWSELMWDLGFLLGLAGFAFLPLATAIAILRYRLYDIDRIINRTLVYGVLTAVLVLVYLGSVVALRGLLFGFTGKSSQLTIVASTLAAAALFNPLRMRIQGFIDRRFYRKKYDARKTLETFSATLRNETDLEALNGDLVRVVSETMQPEHVSLWLRPEAPKGQ